VTGRVGNPIPGFDNWRACTNGRAAVDASVGTEDERTRLLAPVTQRAESPISVQLGRRVSERTLGTNCFWYRTYLHQGSVHVEWEGADGLFNSTTVSPDLLHVGGPSITVSEATAPPGGPAPVRSSGMAPTEQQPEGVTSSAITTPHFPPPQSIHQGLIGWANQMELELVRALGVGRRR